MLAFHNDPAIKQKYLDRVRAHRLADEIVQNYGYWRDGKGCAVGCTLHSGDHLAYETELGIPVMLARIEDVVFEGLPVEAAREWPERFLAAAPIGADLSRVGWRLLHWLLTDETVNPGISHPLVRDAVRECAAVLVPLCRGERIAREMAKTTPAKAAMAADRAAVAAATAEDAANAALAAAASAESAEWTNADLAAWEAAGAVRGAVGTRIDAWPRIADKLIELMELA
jgi:hypothetical protein